MRHLSNSSIILDEYPCMDNDKDDCDHGRKVERKEKSKKGQDKRIMEQTERWGEGTGRRKTVYHREKFEFCQHPRRKMSPCYRQWNYGSDNWTREEQNCHSSFKTCVFLVLTLIALCAGETVPIHYVNAKYLAKVIIQTWLPLPGSHPTDYIRALKENCLCRFIRTILIMITIK